VDLDKAVNFHPQVYLLPTKNKKEILICQNILRLLNNIDKDWEQGLWVRQ